MLGSKNQVRNARKIICEPSKTCNSSIINVDSCTLFSLIIFIYFLLYQSKKGFPRMENSLSKHSS